MSFAVSIVTPITLTARTCPWTTITSRQTSIGLARPSALRVAARRTRDERGARLARRWAHRPHVRSVRRGVSRVTSLVRLREHLEQATAWNSDSDRPLTVWTGGKTEDGLRHLAIFSTAEQAAIAVVAVNALPDLLNAVEV